MPRDFGRTAPRSEQNKPAVALMGEVPGDQHVAPPWRPSPAWRTEQRNRGTQHGEAGPATPSDVQTD